MSSCCKALSSAGSGPDCDEDNRDPNIPMNNLFLSAARKGLNSTFHENLRITAVSIYSRWLVMQIMIPEKFSIRVRSSLV